MSSNSNNFRQLNVTENCSNLEQIAPENPSDASYPMYHTKKRDADMEYLGRVKTMLNSHMGGIKFADPVNTRKAHKELVIQVRPTAIYISNKYTVQLEPLHFEWDRFIPTLEKDFLNTINEMLSHNGQQQPLKLNKK